MRRTYTYNGIGSCELDFEPLVLAETDFPDELMINYWLDKFFDYLGIQK